MTFLRKSKGVLNTVGTPNKGHSIFDVIGSNKGIFVIPLFPILVILGQIRENLEFPYLESPLL